MLLQFKTMVFFGYVTGDKLIMDDIAWVIDDDGQIKWACDCNISGATHEIRNTNDTHCGPACLSLQMRIESCMEHPNFSFEEHKSDIALIKLKSRITFSCRILPACLNAERGDLPSWQDLVVTGWGETQESVLSNDLKKKILRTVDLNTCKTNFLQLAGQRERYRIDESQYCAGDSNHEKDACRGDSGGPIQIFKENAPVATVIGVVSFGRGCPSMLPGVYTRVSYFLDWIEENVW